MTITRRKFIGGLSGGLLLNALPAFTRYAHAQTASDYKALVCIFLFGGNDANNMIVPTDTAGYAKYFAARGDNTTGNGMIGIPQPELLALPPAAGSAQFGAHPEFTELQQVWNAGDLAVLFNVGTLVRPLTKNDYKSPSLRPQNLFSHADQQGQWQSAISSGVSRSGWGGRIADVVRASNGSAPVPPMISLVGPDLFTVGRSTSALSLPQSGKFGINSFGGPYASSVSTALQQMLQTDRDNALVLSAQDTTAAAITSSSVLNPVLSGASSSVDSFFTGQNSGIANQLLQTARIIEARSSLGVTRQIFYVSLSGFDTHNGQIAQQGKLFNQLSPALKAFQDAMAQLGVTDQVTAFTLSDFGRTLEPASGGGSDHAWGNHHLIMGGAVKGQTFYGQFPDHTLGGPDDISDEGRWLPTASVDQYGATLASWFGVAAADLPTVFPNLGNFTATNLGFLS